MPPAHWQERQEGTHVAACVQARGVRARVRMWRDRPRAQHTHRTTHSCGVAQGATGLDLV